MVLAPLYTVVSFFMAMRHLGSGEIGWAIAFGVLFLAFVWMTLDAADRAARRAEARN